MAEKNKLKTTKTRGKGGNILSLQRKGGLFYFITFVLIFLVSFQPVAFAARSSAGGGKIAKPDWGKVATNVGISIGAMAIGSALNSAMSAAQPASTATNTISQTSQFVTNLPQTTGNLLTNTAGGGATVVDAAGKVQTLQPLAAIGNSLKESFSAAGVIKGYSTFVATSQVNRAVGMAGAYYGWKPSNTFIISSLATGATAGFLNPSGVLGSSMTKEMAAGGVTTMAKGALAGGLGGLAGGAATVAVDGSKINKGKNPGVGGQIAGMVGSMYGTSLGKELVSPNSYNTQMAPYKKTVTQKDFDEWSKQELDKFHQQEMNKLLGRQSLDELLGLNANLNSSGPTRSYQNLKDSSDIISTPELNKRAGVSVVESAAIKTAGMTSSQPMDFETAVKIYQSDAVQCLGRDFDGNLKFEIKGKEAVNVTLTEEQAHILETAQVAPADKTTWLPTATKPSSSLVIQRVLFNPLVNTTNQWPVIASGSLAIAASNSMGDNQWRPWVSELIYGAAMPVIDTFATTYELKPSLFSNIDQKLGYVPEAQLERQELIVKAIERMAANDVANASIPVGTLPQELLTKYNLDTGKLRENAEFKAKTENKQLSEFDNKTLLFDSIVNTMGDRARDNFEKEIRENKSSGVYDEMPLFESIGGSKSDIVGYRIHDAFKVDIPVAVISGAIQVGLDKTMGDTTSSKALLASLGGTIASSIARGIVLHHNASDLYNKAINSAKPENGGKFIPEVAIANKVTAPADLILARINGTLPPPDNTVYKLQGNTLVPVEKGEKGYLRAEVNETTVAKDLIFVQNDKVIRPGMEGYEEIIAKAKPASWKLDDKENKWVSVPPGYGEGIRPIEIAKVPGLGTTIKGNISQGLYEFGTKSLAMGLPNTYQGRLGDYGWYKYTQNLGYLSNVANRQGYSAAMNSNAVRVGKDIISGNSLTVLDNVMGLGMAKAVPVTGYKGRPYSEQVIMDRGWSAATSTFYPNWPYSDVNPIQNNPFWSSLNDKLGAQDIRTSEDIKGTQQQQDMLLRATQGQ